MSAAAFPPARTDRVRVLVFMAKKDDMTNAEFFKYWQEQFGPLFTNLGITKKNILKYEQHHYNDVFEEGIKAMGAATTTFQGMCVFEAESYEKVLEVLSSEEYKTICLPAEQNFLNRSKSVLFPGPIVTFLDKN